jgi:hypothetical protein
MKKLLMVTMITLTSFIGFGQDEIVPDIKKFEDAPSKLFMSKVIELPGKTQKELNTQFKNWASTSFVNLKEVMVSETDNQIVLVYITEPIFWYKVLLTKTYYDYKHYVRMVGQFKDGKCKISMYDDGNVFRIGSYVNGVKYPNTEARTLFFAGMDTTKPDPKDYHKMKNMWYGAHSDWQQNVELTLLSCEKGMKDNTLITKKDDF